MNNVYVDSQTLLIIREYLSNHYSTYGNFDTIISQIETEINKEIDGQKPMRQFDEEETFLPNEKYVNLTAYAVVRSTVDASLTVVSKDSLAYLYYTVFYPHGFKLNRLLEDLLVHLASGKTAEETAQASKKATSINYENWLKIIKIIIGLLINYLSGNPLQLHIGDNYYQEINIYESDVSEEGIDEFDNAIKYNDINNSIKDI